MPTRELPTTETAEPRRWRDKAKRIGACGALLLALNSCTGRASLDEHASPPDKRIEVFDDLARKIARFAVCGLDAAPAVVPFTAQEHVTIEGLETPHFDKVDKTSDWAVVRTSDHYGQWGGWFPRPDVPPSKDHIGITVEGSVKKDSDFFKGRLSIAGAGAAISDLTPGLIELSDYPHKTHQAIYNADVEQHSAKDGYVAIQNMSTKQVDELGDSVDRVLDTLLEKNGLEQECGGVIA